MSNTPSKEGAEPDPNWTPEKRRAWAISQALGIEDESTTKHVEAIAALRAKVSSLEEEVKSADDAIERSNHEASSTQARLSSAGQAGIREDRRRLKDLLLLKCWTYRAIEDDTGLSASSLVRLVQGRDLNAEGIAILELWLTAAERKGPVEL